MYWSTAYFLEIKIKPRVSKTTSLVQALPKREAIALSPIALEVFILVFYLLTKEKRYLEKLNYSRKKSDESVAIYGDEKNVLMFHWYSL